MQLYDVSEGRTVPPVAISAALNAAFRMRSRPADRSIGEGGRYDADGYVALDDTIEHYHRHVDGLAIRALGQGWRPGPELVQRAQRADALPIGAGGFPRDFEYIRRTVLEEKRQPLTAMSFFPIDTSVPLGARTHTARRSLGYGEAQIYRGGAEHGRARVTFAEEVFNTCFITCAVDQNLFDSFSTDFASLGLYEKELRHAYRLVEERRNRIWWFGDVGANLYGVANYPSLAKTVVSTAFTSSSTPEAIVAALRDFVNTPMVQSGLMFSATDLLVSPKIGSYLSTPMTSFATMTILKTFMEGQAQIGNAGIRSINIAPELAGIGPSGTDAMLAYRKDLDTVGLVDIQPPTALPVFQASPLDQTTVVFSSIGGASAYDVGNMHLGYVTV
jgi:hypothetical protein